MCLRLRTLCSASLIVLSCLYVPLVEAAAQASRTITYLHEITRSQVGELELPTDVAVHESRLYIVDSGNNRVVVLGRNGETQFAFGSKGTANGEFNGPVGIGVGHDGRIYVADTGNHRIQIFSATGKFQTAIATTTGEVRVRPIDVAVEPKSGHIFITGNNNHRVMVYNHSGRLLREWGGNGAAIGKFRYPATITVMPDANIGVIDVFNTRAQLFQPDGRFVVKIGEWGVLPGQLFRPKGIAIDRKGHIYISDSYLNVIQVFNDSGKFLHVLTQKDTAHTMMTPTGIAVAADNRLYVAEMLRHRVAVYQMD